MKKKYLIFTITLASVLIISSLVAVSQAWHPSKATFVSFDLQGIYVRGASTADNSSAPNLIIIKGTNVLISGNLTIGDKTYVFPRDFTLNSSFQLSYSAITGEGVNRIQNTVTFNMANNPTITIWGVAQVTGFPTNPLTGSFNNTKLDGEFQLTGTDQLSTVNGFGLQNGRYLPPDMNLNGHIYGYINGWPL